MTGYRRSIPYDVSMAYCVLPIPVSLDVSSAQYQDAEVSLGIADLLRKHIFRLICCGCLCHHYVYSACICVRFWAPPTDPFCEHERGDQSLFWTWRKWPIPFLYMKVPKSSDQSLFWKWKKWPIPFFEMKEVTNPFLEHERSNQPLFCIWKYPK